jgi:hypothetical protein
MDKIFSKKNKGILSIAAAFLIQFVNKILF